MSLLEVENLRTYFYTQEGMVRAVDGISFSVERGEALGIVGESGAGKSVAVKSLLGLIESPGRIVDGSIRFDGQELTEMSEKDLRKQVRGSEISIVFQDPMSSLNPVFTVGHQIAEVIQYHEDASKKEARRRAEKLLEDVGIPDPERVVDDYPHQLSGGMRQRALIAMALSCQPKLIIADEPTTALDVTIQAGILELLDDIRAEYDTSIVYVTHDLGVVRELCDRVAVMYLGEIVERGPYRRLYEQPRHPYTQSLLKSVVTPDERHDDLDPIEGSMPSASNPPSGCRFRTRCPLAFEDCARRSPPLYDVSEDQSAACLLYDEAYGADEPRLHEVSDR